MQYENQDAVNNITLKHSISIHICTWHKYMKMPRPHVSSPYPPNILYQSNQVWTHLLIQWSFFICIIWHQNYEKTHMELCSKQKRKSEYVLYFRSFKVATFCFDDSFVQSWHSLTSISFMRYSNGMVFQQSWTSSQRWLLFLHSAVQLIPSQSQFGLGQMIVAARSSDTALHHSPSWSNSHYILEVCLGSLSC